MRNCKLIMLSLLSLLASQYMHARNNSSQETDQSVEPNKPGNPVCEIDKSRVLDYSKKKCEDLDLSKEDILSALNISYKKMTSTKKKLAPISISFFSAEALNFSKIRDLEKETKIKKVWYQNLAKIYSALYSCRMKLEEARMNKNAKQFSDNKAKYYKLLATLKKIYKNPPKIKEKIKRTTSRRSNG